MTLHQALADVLDQTVEGLVSLDLARLDAAEQRIEALADSRVIGDEEGILSLLMKRRLLEIVLRKSEQNLDALNLLRDRGSGGKWPL